MSDENNDSTSLSGSTIAVTGATGLVGASLSQRLQESGAEVIRLVRSTPSDPETEVQWSAEQGLVEPDRLEAVSAVVHLAGENIASGRWTQAKKRRIRDSRVIGTQSLCRSLAALQQPPATLVCASAIGYYGDRGEAELDESSPPGEGFLPEVCVGWEEACQPARNAGIRVVNLRIGVILSRDGGALATMLLPFKMGIGGKVGSGRQYISWVSLDDIVGMVVHSLERPDLSGPVNGVAPSPVTNAEFTKTLGKVLHRPTLFPLPGFAAKLALGQMAEDLLLASAKVLPTRLQETGYQFHHTDLCSCLEAELA